MNRSNKQKQYTKYMEENNEEKIPSTAAEQPSTEPSGLNTEGADELEAAPGAESSQPKAEEKAEKSPDKKKGGSFVSRLASRLNIYLVGFILVIVLSLIIMFVVISSSNRQTAEREKIQTQELTQEAIDSLTGNEVTVGDPKQLLSVESNAVFAGKVLIRDGLDVAGPIKVGGDLNLPGITVSGKSAFDEVQVNSLSIAGDTSVQGILTVQNRLTVNGPGAFAGPISAPSIVIDALQINGDIQFNRHIDAGGRTPSVARGGAVGGSGTVTISGTDTAGTVTVNVGGGATSGSLATVTFVNRFNGNPHVVITPVTSNAAMLGGSVRFYLSNRTATSFTIATTSALPSGSISFDYIVID